jgi:antitoxin MazE
MDTRVQKWGNSLAIRIPKKLAEEVDLAQGSPVDLRVDEGGIRIVPSLPPAYSLGDLLAEVSDENVHGSVDFGDGVGREEL